VAQTDAQWPNVADVSDEQIADMLARLQREIASRRGDAN
jgi:hypothetical protein